MEMHSNFCLFFFSNLKTANFFEGEEGSTDSITQTRVMADISNGIRNLGCLGSQGSKVFLVVFSILLKYPTFEIVGFFSHILMSKMDIKLEFLYILVSALKSLALKYFFGSK